MPPRYTTLDAWLEWLEQAHPVKIDLELTRIREVARRMALLTPPFTVITVGGTNGKGSSVAMLEAILSTPPAIQDTHQFKPAIQQRAIQDTHQFKDASESASASGSGHPLIEKSEKSGTPIESSANQGHLLIDPDTGESGTPNDCGGRARGGWRVGCYTSPHVHRYNERIRIGGREVDDASLVAAFAAIDAARGEISLSYFEFGVLAALWLFHREAVDVAVLEVGLGGRLDAVNIVDADVALITSIDIDHVHWLGDTREKIAVEKAAIARRGRPVVVADPEPPANLAPLLLEIGARPLFAGEDYRFERHGNRWTWSGMGETWADLPLPALAGAHQLRNAAGVIAVCRSLPEQFRCAREVVAAALPRVNLPGRFERISGPWEAILDVAHNPAGMRALAENLAAQPSGGRTYTLFGAMADKAIPEMIECLAGVTDHWLLAAPDCERAESPRRLRRILGDILPRADVSVFGSVAGAIAAARQRLGTEDRLVVCGSFYTVGEARDSLLATPMARQ